MSKINDGGYAFPTDPRFPKSGIGMSLRDYFAGQALCGLLASGHFTVPSDLEEGDGAWMTTHRDWESDENPARRLFDFPEAAWRCADAMLRERSQEEETE
jgi:hypothetical protein